jgi:hypothetical protein
MVKNMKVREKIKNEVPQDKAGKTQKKENVFDEKAKELASQIIDMAKQSYMNELQKVSSKDAKQFESEAKAFIEKALKDIVKKYYYVIGFPMANDIKVEKLGKDEKYTYGISFSLRLITLPSVMDSPYERKMGIDLLDVEMRLSFKAVKK